MKLIKTVCCNNNTNNNDCTIVFPKQIKSPQDLELKLFGSSFILIEYYDRFRPIRHRLNVSHTKISLFDFHIIDPCLQYILL